jgi:transcription antitermination factor NusG
VRVTHGPLEGIEGILLRKKNTFRLVLSMEMLRKAVAVEVDTSMVEPITSQDWSLIHRESAKPLYSAC